MKWNNFFHILSALGCIGGIISLYQYGLLVYQWPIICLIWIANSYISTFTCHKNIVKVEKLKDNNKILTEELNKCDTFRWKETKSLI
jgi:hypothetical protein